jgi:Na+/proline symporter
MRISHISVDVVLFSIFLGTNLIVGLLAGRRVKTLREYSIGNKNFSTAALTSTIVATWISGSFMTFKLAKIYSEGWYFILAIICDNFGLLVIGLFLAVRLGEFLKNASVAEAMGDLYGPIVRFITAICGILISIGGVAIQFKVSAKVLGMLLGANEVYSTIAAATILITYAAFGGIRAVAFTDIMQFFAFGTFLPLLGLSIWHGIKDHTAVIHALQTSPQFDYRTLIGSPKQLLSCLALMLFYFIPGFEPPVFQRVTMANNVGQVKRSFIYSFFLCLAITLFTIWIGILILGANSQLEPGQIFNYIVETYTYPGLKGLILVGTMSMVMSTADSHINAAAVLFANDIAKPLKLVFKPEIITAKVFAFVVGIIALLLALYKVDFLDLVLWAWGFYMPIVTVPLLLAIFGFRSTTRAVLIGMAAGFITVVLWDKLLGNTGINSVIPGMVANLVFFMSSHYILREKGGWVGIGDPYPLLAARQERQDAWRNFIQFIKNPYFFSYLKKNLPTKEIIYFLFGLYVLGATYASFFTIPTHVVASYQKLYDHIAHSVLIITACFITYPAWPPTFKGKRFIAVAWPLGICYILFIVGTILMVMSGFHQVQVMLFILNLVLTALLLDWRLMLGIVGSGIILAIGAFYLYVGKIPVIKLDDTLLQFKVIYGLPIFISFLLVIIGFRQSREKLADQTNYLLMAQEKAKDRFIELANYREELLKELNPAEIKIFDQVTSAYLKQAIYRVRDYLRLEVSGLAIDTFFSEVRALLKVHTIKPHPQLLVKNYTKHRKIQADITKIKQLLINSISYIQTYNPHHIPVIVTIEDASLGYELSHIGDYIKKVEAVRITVTIENQLPTMRETYISKEQEDNSKSLPMTIELLPLVENARIIDAHYGYLEQDKNKLHMYVIPVNVREVRSEVMELIKKPVAADPAELAHPLAIQLEKELLAKLQENQVDIQVINKALDIIKKYHGGIKRRSGEPYFTHPMAVALILLDYSQDQDAVVAALLHDIVEDTSLSISHIQAIFGEDVGFLVGKATKLENNLKRLNLTDHENLHKLIYYEDKRAALVKLADRLHNMRTIEGHSSIAKQKRIASETLTFFVSVAKYLELTDMAQELERLSLEVLGK